ncbi:NAD(P)-binding domain protein [Niveomyces insectorum RCEF 264]|uniref:NAD(P)-binding domain protein n=1 Tax=Niveomyces insectorum RCEF 264 TaxID=1081102 RepID=A0A167SHW3_9HYPO|nr:NAD(P)-binding domain protein [Niveomyces insectorum RCEF 264]
MATTTHPEFGASTEALDVAKAFADQLRGKTVLITGVNRDGIGFTTAQAFASQRPAHLIFAGRNPAKLQACIDALREAFPDVDYRALPVDLGSQASVRAAAAVVLAWDDVPVLDLLVNNAAVMLLPERTLSVDGIELHFATNHLGHFLLTNLLMPKLLAAAARPGVPVGAVRVVNVSARIGGAAGLRWSDTNFETPNKDLPAAEQPRYDTHKMWGYGDTRDAAYVPIEGYFQSKVANVLFGVGLTDRLYATHGVRGIALHPGVILTELGRNQTDATKAALQDLLQSGAYTLRTQGAGAATTLVAALDPKLGEAGGTPPHKAENYGAYLMDCQINDGGNPSALSSSEATKLWAMSEKMVGETFSW